MLLIFELIAVVVFAVTGVTTALEKKLDVFGAIVLGLCTAVGGGIIRDILLGYLPPTAFRDPIYSITALIASAICFIVLYIFGERIHSHAEIYNQIINVFDASGLAIFTIGGVHAAIDHGFGDNLYLSVFVGLMTGVGGGVMRDVMVGKIPMIFRKRIYALAALPGAIAYQIIMENEFLEEIYAFIACTSIIFVIRMLATIFRWNLPKFKDNETTEKTEEK